MSDPFDMTLITIDAVMLRREGAAVELQSGGRRGWVIFSFGGRADDVETLREGPLGVPVTLDLPAFLVRGNGWRAAQ